MVNKIKLLNNNTSFSGSKKLASQKNPYDFCMQQPSKDTASFEKIKSSNISFNGLFFNRISAEESAKLDTIATEFLQKGNVKEFNKLRKDNKSYTPQFKEMGFQKAHIWGANLNYANFEKANLEDVEIGLSDLYKTNFNNANLKSALIPMVEAKKATFVDANLEDVDFRYSNLKKADFSGANLKMADFRYTCLDKADFKNSDLAGAKLIGASLKGVNLNNACLDCVEINNSELEKTTKETRAYVEKYYTKIKLSENRIFLEKKPLTLLFPYNKYV